MALLIGIIGGFVMSIPIGPINVWVIKTCVKKGMKISLAIALGGSVMDFIYFFIVLSGLSWLEFSESLAFYLKLIGVCFIFLLGLRELMAKNILLHDPKYRATPKELLGAVLLGVIIYTSNPTLLFTMTALGAFLKSLELFPFTQWNILLISTGVGLGTFLWFVVLTQVIRRYREVILKKYLSYFTKISGILMITLSVIMATQWFQN